MEKSHVTTKNLLKFLLGSAFGILMFLVPVPQGESFTTLLDFLKSWVKGLFGGSLPYIIMVILIVSAIVSLYDYFAKPEWIRKNHYLIPIVVSWGTIALMIATYTPFFNWVSYPMGMFLNALGVPEAFAAAPATLVGFTDMFIPALLAVGLTSVKTKFVIGVLSLVQIIYLTEVGTIIIKSEIPLNFWKLLVIFLERTVIAIPLIVLFANLFGIG